MPESTAPGFDDLAARPADKLSDKLNDAALRIHRSADLPGLLETARTELGSLLGAKHVLVYLYDEKWNDLHGPSLRPEGGAAARPGEDEVRFPVGQGIAGVALQRGVPVRAPNAPEEEAYVAEIDSPPEGEEGDAGAAWRGQRRGPDCAVLAVPMFDSGGAPLGVLEALGSREGGFDEAQEAAARTLARHVGIALVHARRRGREKAFVLDLAGALAGAVDRLSLSTVDHTYRVREYCRALGRAAGLDETSRYALEAAAVLHDMGKVELEIKEQPDGTLDAAAVEMMKPHVLVLEALLRNVAFPEWLREVPEIVACHHEFLDGSGYPRGRSGEEIPRLARMLAVADSYDACLYGRRPRAKVTKSGRFVPGAESAAPAAVAEAIEYLKAHAAELFDADVVRLFVEHRCHAIEQRRFPRIEIEAPVEVTVIGPGGREQGRFETQVLDISEGGVLFRASDPIPPHTLVRLAIRLRGEKLDAIARVARCLPGDDAGKRIGAWFLWYDTSTTETQRHRERPEGSGSR